MNNGNLPAYPISNTSHRGDLGLTKREQFAAMAMQGFLAKEDYDAASDILARDAVEMADALLKELDTRYV